VLLQKSIFDNYLPQLIKAGDGATLVTLLMELHGHLEESGGWSGLSLRDRDLLANMPVPSRLDGREGPLEPAAVREVCCLCFV
jgi:hypothetical protein